MLVLTRKLKEAIQIGDDIEVVVLAIDGDQVKLGIRAPKHIDVHRKEIYLAIQAENNAASLASITSLQQLSDQLKKGGKKQ
ncbi:MULTISPECIES: carbon storage regulator CsrA [Anoxybacillus]|uniref:Translational regulator CsrA n=1 Tax=Anoxybacillus kestanbolensis TaxID=227476 RepID=A0A1V3FPR7_9BACL|nr:MULTISPECIES: carbon storage regulator CsrA [Anoxybacillus]MBE2940847.1 carbon storage regulator CsrA [Anoxybacillus flavithermus]MBE2943536.1 carbon storage regulator CsrA [Anoxybacillus flavithermus]MBE2951827.1 carbon storage regulator CsrA [Anoxybacillus flavithermus]MBE2954418.1 carbon storage regulator CsrA [Anoxybacillus flavithermus]MBE2959860.1 carbon storage regulator CsrA [Anoxybacillus flavithermus]